MAGHAKIVEHLESKLVRGQLLLANKLKDGKSMTHESDDEKAHGLGGDTAVSDMPNFWDDKGWEPVAHEPSDTETSYYFHPFHGTASDAGFREISLDDASSDTSFETGSEISCKFAQAMTKVSTEMVQTSLPFAPPSSPNLSLSKCFNTSSDAQELVKAVVDMKIASGRAPNCTCSQTPPEDASGATPTEPYLPTPGFAFPANQPLAQVVTTEHVQQFLDILKSLGTQQGPPPPPTKPSSESGGPKARASRLEFKTVNEMYVEQGTRSERLYERGKNR